MAWNPEPEVAAVRDAANKLNAPFAVMIYLDSTGEQIGMASYGKTKELCKHAGEFGKHLLAAARRWGEDEEQQK